MLVLLVVLVVLVVLLLLVVLSVLLVLVVLVAGLGSIVLQLSVSHLEMEEIRGRKQEILLTRTGQRGQ